MTQRKQDEKKRLQAEEMEKRAAPLTIYYTEESGDPSGPAPGSTGGETTADTDQTSNCGVKEGGLRSKLERPEKLLRR